jgi:hypothetical protein
MKVRKYTSVVDHMSTDTRHLHQRFADVRVHEVEVDLNMLGSLMLNRVGGEINGADIITINHCSTTEWTAKL